MNNTLLRQNKVVHSGKELIKKTVHSLVSYDGLTFAFIEHVYEDISVIKWIL